MATGKPKTFITDQALAIMKAIYVVMPETYHRLCVWQLEKNAFKNLSHIFRGTSSFCRYFGKLIYEYQDNEQFMDDWNIILEKYDLKDNNWLKETFKLKEKWSMAYGRCTFFVGMRSTQLSESFNGSLRDYLKSDLDLVQFFKHFQRAVDEKRYNELLSNHDMLQRFSVLRVDIPLLRHARDVYTSAIFEIFQEECVKSLLVIVNPFYDNDDNGQIIKYTAIMQDGTREHIVTVSPLDLMVSCSCKLFVGILCSHALKVLDILNVKKEIPMQYILRQWTKEATMIYDMDTKENKETDHILEVTRPYRNLCSTYISISNEACGTSEDYGLAMKNAYELVAKLRDVVKA